MKVLHCITGLGFGGAQVMLYRYLSGLGAERKNHEVISLLPPEHFSHEIEKLGVKVSSANLPAGWINYAGLRKIRTHIATMNPDIIHCWMYHGNFLASLANYRLGSASRVVWSVHHSLHDLASESRSTRILLKLSAPMSRHVGAITYCSKESQKQHHDMGFYPAKSHIIPNGTDLAEYKPDKNAKAHLCELADIPTTRILLGNINRNHPMKDQVSLVKSTAILCARGWDVHLILIGDGHVGSEASAAAAALGIEDRYSDLPARNDISEIVPGLDLFVLSSAWGEAFSLSVGEAMAAQVPAVVTDVGDSSWLVGDAGVVVPPTDSMALANGIETILKMPDKDRDLLGQSARKRIQNLFSLETYIEAHQKLYKNIMSMNS